MSSRILKGIAVAVGTGLGVGFGGGRKRQSLSMSNLPNDPGVTDRIEDRLDRIEERVKAVENANRPMLESIVDTMLTPYVEQLRAQLQREMREAMEARLTGFERSIESKVSTRMAALEKALVDQSAVITALSQRAVEAEQNFQRLISAVERLFEQRGIAPVASDASRHHTTAPPGVSPGAFEEHFKEALQSGPVVVPEGFRPRIVSEEEAKSGRHRRPLSRL